MSYQITFILTKAETIEVKDWEDHYSRFVQRMREEVQKFPDHTEADLHDNDVVWMASFLQQRGVHLMVVGLTKPMLVAPIPAGPLDLKDLER